MTVNHEPYTAKQVDEIISRVVEDFNQIIVPIQTAMAQFRMHIEGLRNVMVALEKDFDLHEHD